MSDRGGGIPHKLVSKVFEYNFTTSGVAKQDQEVDIFDTFMNDPQATPLPGKMHGYVDGLLV